MPSYRISPGEDPIDPANEVIRGIGVEFQPAKVVYNAVANFLHIKERIKVGAYPADAPTCKDYDSIELPEFLGRLSTMVYDPINDLTMEAAVGGLERFKEIVGDVHWDILKRNYPSPDSDSLEDRAN